MRCTISLDKQKQPPYTFIHRKQYLIKGQTGIIDSKTAPRVGKLLCARNVIFGNLALGSIKATTTLASADQGTVKGSVTAIV